MRQRCEAASRFQRRVPAFLTLKPASPLKRAGSDKARHQATRPCYAVAKHGNRDALLRHAARRASLVLSCTVGSFRTFTTGPS